MTKKRINKILWYGSDLKDGEAKAPSVASLGNNGLDGINDGELYICNADEDPAIFTKTNKGRAVRVGGGTGNGYTKEEIDTFLGKKLDKSVWDSVFKIHYGEDGSVRWIETLFDLVVDGGITMYGIGDHTASTIMDGILVDGTTIGIVDGKLSVIGDIGGGTANGIRVNGSLYSPDEDGIITIPNYPTSLAWNDITGKPGWIGSTKPSYSWDEINSKPSVFPTDWENVSGKPSWIGTNKPSYDFSEISNKPTTLAGYGITDAYTKDGISELLDGYVTLNGAQDITGVKSFVNGVNIGDILVKKHSDRVVELDGDLIVTGSITIFAQGSHTASTILDALPIDETTLSKEGNKLSVIGGVGGGSVDGIILNGKTYSPDGETKLITLPDYPTSMDWGSITNTPSTLAGYGITDAYTKQEINTTVYSKSECDEFFVNKSGDTMTGDLNVNGYLFGGNETFLARPEYAFFGKDYGIYFYYLTGNTLQVSTHNNRLYQAHSFDIYIDSGVVNFQNGIYINNAAPGITLMRTNDTPYIRFANSNGSFCGEIGVSLDGRLVFWPTVSSAPGYNKWNTVLHKGNYSGVLDNRYVLKAGDTMTGDLHFSSNTKIYFNNNENFSIGSNGSVGTYLKYDTNILRVTSGHPYYNNDKIWHAGNDGSGSGLDADMLDGRNASNSNGSIPYLVNYPSWNDFGNESSTDNQVYYKNILKWAYANENHRERTLLVGVGNPNSLGNLQVQLYGTSGVNNEGMPKYSSGIYIPLYGLPTVFGTNNYSYYEYYIASTNSNVASATRLQTPRYIYGNLFDGTSDIPVTAVGKMRYLLFTKSNGNELGYIGRGSSSTNDIELINYEGNLVLGANNNDGVTITTNHRVGIGMSAPDYKLHVNGDIGSNGLIHSVSNGISSSFGAQNSSYCHMMTTAPSFYFEKQVTINGECLSYVDGGYGLGSRSMRWGDVHISGWYRTYADAGWYNEKHDGGIYMTDSSYVRVYKGKKFYTSSSYYDAISTEGGFTCYANRSYSLGNGFGTINQSIPNDRGQTPLIVAYRSGSSGTTNGSNRLFSVECLNSGMEVDLLFGGDIQFLFSNSGNFLANGGITMYYSSDMNLKVNVRPVTNASERLMSIGGVYDFEYIDSEVERNSIYAGTHTGLIYQNVKGGVMDCMAYEREDGKGALNYIDPSFISLLAAVEIEHEGRIQVLESENKMLKANNEELMNRINELERRIA